MFLTPSEKFLFHISRRDIEDCRCTRVLDAFSPAQLSADMLRRMEGAVTFIVTGYEKDHRELFEIPEVREFLKVLHEESDGSLAFFSELRTSYVATLARCQMSPAEADKKPRTELVSYPPDFFILFFQSSTDAIRRLATAAGLTRVQIMRRERRFASYLEDHFGLEDFLLRR